MAQLTSNTQLLVELPGLGDLNDLPIKASTEIFQGSAVGVTSGYARQLVAGDLFGGFAEQHVNNSVATDGAAIVPVRQGGRVVLSITSAAVTDIGKPVYASDGNTFTFTATSNTRIGTVVRWVSAGVVVVQLLIPKYAVAGGGGTITDSTGGTASTTFAAITAGATYAQADMVAVKNALSQIALSLNLLQNS